MFSAVQNLLSFNKDPNRKDSTAILRKNRADNDGSGPEEKEAIVSEHRVSVSSALKFLEGFLEAKIDSSVHTESLRDQIIQSKWYNKEKAVNTQSRDLANKAYRHMAEIVKGRLSAGQKSGHDNLIDIYKLIQSLRELEQNGQEVLEIPADMSFMDAIQFAVKGNLKTTDR